ncbi:MAG: hypothetical protein JWP29_618, partial [Rhodoferax sp.]|nr:hypothetical protein [Rhodoferax sp.]
MMPSIAEWVHRLPYYPFFPPPTHESPALIAEGSEVSHAARVLMAEAVRRVEAEGPLDDAQLLRTMAADEAAADADRGANSGEAWLLARGWGLGRRLGLDAQLQRWRGAGGLALALLVGLVVLAALGAAGTVVHSGRTVNAVAAFFTLLGLHGLTLAVWLIGLVAPWPASGGALGRLWLETVARFSRNSNPQAASLLSASLGLLRRERLAPCLFGWVSHTVWALSFGVVLAVLGFAFSFQAYRLTWETTILGPDFFVGFVQATGWLPGHLGFAVPDTATLLAPGAAAADQRAWAWWLIGCVAVYGLLPRAVLAAVCAWWWRRRARSLRLETSDPYYRVLLARREALQPAAVVDAEAPWQAPAADHAQPMPAGQGAALLGFELPPEAAWPPFALPAEAWSRRIAGTSSERVEVLEALRTARPARLLLACHAASSPDRGTARFVREAAASVGACRVLLVVDQPADTADTADTARWTHWLHG